MFWVILGRIESILGQKSALPKLLKNTIVLCTYSVSNAYFTVLNVPNDRMTHPWFAYNPPQVEFEGWIMLSTFVLALFEHQISLRSLLFYAQSFAFPSFCCLLINLCASGSFVPQLMWGSISVYRWYFLTFLVILWCAFQTLHSVLLYLRALSKDAHCSFPWPHSCEPNILSRTIKKS